MTILLLGSEAWTQQTARLLTDRTSHTSSTIMEGDKLTKTANLYPPRILTDPKQLRGLHAAHYVEMVIEDRFDPWRRYGLSEEEIAWVVYYHNVRHAKWLLSKDYSIVSLSAVDRLDLDSVLPPLLPGRSSTPPETPPRPTRENLNERLKRVADISRRGGELKTKSTQPDGVEINGIPFSQEEIDQVTAEFKEAFDVFHYAGVDYALSTMKAIESRKDDIEWLGKQSGPVQDAWARDNNYPGRTLKAFREKVEALSNGLSGRTTKSRSGGRQLGNITCPSLDSRRTLTESEQINLP